MIEGKEKNLDIEKKESCEVYYKQKQMIVETRSPLTFPSSIPIYALRRFPELITFLSKLGHPSATVTPISFRDKNLRTKSFSK